MKITHVEDHGPLRRAAYPDVGDQLDAIWTTIAQMSGYIKKLDPTFRLPNEAQAIMDRLDAVREAIPKA